MIRRVPQKNKVKNAGFTLVELVVVLVVLALLAALISPALLGYIDRANRESETDNAKAVFNALTSRLTALYDQGIMPNQEFHGMTNNGTAGFLWREDWTGDVLYNSGIKQKPYICAYFTGNLTEGAGSGSYLGSGLSGLKKGYTVYAFIYVEKQDSEPVIYYDGDWESTSLKDVMDSNFISLRNGEKIFRSRMCTLYGCTGNDSGMGNAIATHDELRDVYSVLP